MHVVLFIIILANCPSQKMDQNYVSSVLFSGKLLDINHSYDHKDQI